MAIIKRDLSIQKSPFFLLGVSTRDDRKLIVERAEERSLAVDPASCQQARSELTNPRTRLAAEISWLPGVSPRKATALLYLLMNDPLSVRGEEGIPTLAQCNLMASAFEAVGSDHSEADVALFAEQFARQVDELDAEVVLRAINEDRAISGFPEVKGIELVQEEIAQRKRAYCNAIKDALNQLPPNDLIGAMTRLLESTTSNGTRHAPELIDELVDSYAVETQQFLQQEAENAEKLIGAARAAASNGESAVKSIIDRLEGVLRNWERVAQPLQLSFKVRGMDHDSSKSLAFKIRNLAVDLFNVHDNLSQSKRLTQLLKEIFSEVPDIVDRVNEDAKNLADIAMRREESLAIKPIRTLCEEISKSADKNPLLAQHEGQRLLDEGKALLKAVPVKATSTVYVEARDMLAATLMHCAVAYGNETSKWESCIQLLRAALELANDKKLIQKLRENLTIVEGNHKSLGDLEPIKAAPSLYIVNGVGLTLYGSTDRNPSDGSYMATYYLVFFFIPLFPLARYRVIPKGGGYRFLGKGPLRPFDKWHIVISIGLIALLFLEG